MRAGYLWVAAAALSWGTWPLWVRGVPLGQFTIAMVVQAVLGLCGLPFALLVTRGRRRAGRAAGRLGILWIGLLGLSDAGNNVLYFAALGQGAVGVAVLAHYLAPVLVAALAPRLLGESLGRRTPAAVAAGLAGLALLVWPGRGAGGPAAARAAGLGAASAVFYAGNLLIGKRGLRHLAPLELQVYHGLVGAALLLPFGGRGLWAARPAALWPVAAGALFLGLGGGWAFYRGLRQIPTPHAGVITYLEPLVAVAVGVVLFGEHLSALGGLGGALVVGAGMAVITDRASAAA